MGRYDSLLDTPDQKPVENTQATPPSEKPQAAPLVNTPKLAGEKASQEERKHASKQVSTLAETPDNLVETIRKSVKQVGKDVIYVRLTSDEKVQLSDIVYTHKRQGTKTSENEIARIGLNSLVENYKANGETSVLAKVLAALNA